MTAAVEFYEALGMTVEFASRPTRRGDRTWVEMRGHDGWLALHHVSADAVDTSSPAAIWLAFEADDEPLEAVVERLQNAGYELASAIVDESFGRSFTVRDPEGLLIQVNENDRELQA